jgi:hypothetical protein
MSAEGHTGSGGNGVPIARAMLLGVLLLAVVGLVASAVSPGRAGAVVGSNANGQIQMLSPHQKIHFNVANKYVEYWNYEYPEGAGTLHYVSTITCSYIDPSSGYARFMFQIPEGHPGLSGLYVVSTVTILNAGTKSYLYGHAATADLATATQWCQTGVGFGPAMYPVKSGVLYVKPASQPAVERR